MPKTKKAKTLSHTTIFRLFIGAALIIFLAIVATLFICSKKPKPLRIGYIPIADCSQLFVAVDRGFLREEEIEPELVSMAGGPRILEALGSGSLDVGFSNIVSLVLAHEANLHFKIISGGPAEDAEHAEHAIVVAHSSSIKKISDLSGKKIALNIRKNIDELMVTVMLKQNDVSVDSVKFVEIPFPKQPTVISSGEVDAIATIEPFVTVSLDAGHTVISRNYIDVDSDIDISAYIATENWIHGNSDMALKFRHALQKATKFISSNPAETREILGKYSHLDRKLLDRITMPKFRTASSLASIDRTINHLVNEGWIKSSFSSEELVAIDWH